MSSEVAGSARSSTSSPPTTSRSVGLSRLSVEAGRAKHSACCESRSVDTRRGSHESRTASSPHATLVDCLDQAVAGSPPPMRSPTRVPTKRAKRSRSASGASPAAADGRRRSVPVREQRAAVGRPHGRPAAGTRRFNWTSLRDSVAVVGRSSRWKCARASDWCERMLASTLGRHASAERLRRSRLPASAHGPPHRRRKPRGGRCCRAAALSEGTSRIRQAQKRTSATSLHEWRKATKYLLNAMSMLAPTSRGRQRTFVDAHSASATGSVKSTISRSWRRTCAPTQVCWNRAPPKRWPRQSSAVEISCVARRCAGVRLCSRRRQDSSQSASPPRIVGERPDRKKVAAQRRPQALEERNRQVIAVADRRLEDPSDGARERGSDISHFVGIALRRDDQQMKVAWTCDEHQVPLSPRAETDAHARPPCGDEGGRG